MLVVEGGSLVRFLRGIDHLYHRLESAVVLPLLVTRIGWVIVLEWLVGGNWVLKDWLLVLGEVICRYWESRLWLVIVGVVGKAHWVLLEL